MTPFRRISTTSIGRNKNTARVWLEGRYLLQAGFAPAKNIEVAFAPQRIRITLAPNGARKISSKRNGQIPVLDLNSARISDTFGEIELLQVHITQGEILLTPAYSQRLRATRCRNGKEGSLYSGGGLLTEAARLAGYSPAFAVEVNPDYAAIYEDNHTEARMFNLSVEDLPLDSLPPVELLTMGIPCEPYSQSRTLDRSTGKKRDRALPPEAHPLSDLTIWAALVIRKLNPATVVIEEAPGYLTSGAGYMLCHFLERAGYTVEAAVLDPRDFGELTGRRRSVVVAHSGSSFTWPTPTPCTRKLADVMDDPSTVESEFFTAHEKPWLVNHWEKQTAKGNGFAPPQLTEESTSIPTFKRRYLSMQGDGAVIAHKTKPNCWRWFTVNEIRKLHGVPETYRLHEDQSKVRAGEVLGQGVIVSLFQRIIAATRNLGPAQTPKPYSQLDPEPATIYDSQLGLTFA